MNEKISEIQQAIIEVAKHQDKWPAQDAVDRARHIVNEILKVEHVPVYRGYRVVTTTNVTKHLTVRKLNQLVNEAKHSTEANLVLYIHPLDLDSFIKDGTIHLEKKIFGTDINL